MYTAATAFIDALQEAGVSYIFANFGSDHPGLIESLAEAKANGRPVPKVVTCPTEMMALSAAHGFAQVTGQAQAVLVHVDVGTQALGGAVHNAARARMPVLIFAGTSPFTQNGELRGTRNEHTGWLQDSFDQRGIVRTYMKYDNEVRTGRNIKQTVHRALQFAHSDPKGPVYLMGAREVMEEEIPPVTVDPKHWMPVTASALPAESLTPLIADLLSAKRPLIVTSYAGRNPQAMAELVKLCNRLAIGVLESVPHCINYPATDSLYMGNQWNEQQQVEALGDADVVLVIDADIPWIPSVNKPNDSATIYHIDVDPLKVQTPLFHVAAQRVWRADAATALAQINDRLDQSVLNTALIEERRAHYKRLHDAREKELQRREQVPSGAITPAFLSATIGQFVDERTTVLNDGISNYGTIIDHLRCVRPHSMFTAGGGSLGWNSGAAIGVKLALPEQTVICVTGDGCYMASEPASAHWVARHCKTPFLQIIYNNGGWRAPRLSMLAWHPDGFAAKTADLGLSFEPTPDYSGVAAAAGGAHAEIISEPGKLSAAIAKALDVVRNEGRCAVLDVRIKHP